MKNQSSEEKKTRYEFRCHSCGEEFEAAGMLMDSFASFSFFLIDPKKCPNCGSIRIMPVMFENDEFQAERYQSMWEQKEKKAETRRKNERATGF